MRSVDDRLRKIASFARLAGGAHRRSRCVTVFTDPTTKARALTPAVLAAASLAALGIAAWLVLRPPTGDSTESRPAPARWAPPPPRPVPVALHDRHEEIRRLEKKGSYEEAARRSLSLLKELSREWGAESPDLAPYHYDLALALKLASRRGEALNVASEALRRWPECFSLELFCATTRAEAALARGAFDASADAALRKVLLPGNLPRLRGLRVDPASLHAQRGEMLLRGFRAGEALRAADEGLALDPRSGPLRQLRGRALLALHRPREALAALAGASGGERTTLHQLYLGLAHLESGDPASAHRCFSPLLERAQPGLGEPGGGRPGMGSPENPFDASVRSILHIQAGRALNGLGRHREAAETLLLELLRDPESVEALNQLAASVQGLGSPEGANALHARVRGLIARDNRLISARQARAVGYPSSVLFHQAQAALEVERTGEALKLFQEGLLFSPRNAQLHVEAARVRSLLGRLDLAEHQLEEGLRATGSPLARAELAHVIALRGRREEAARLLEDPGPPGEARKPGEEEGGLPLEESLAATRRARGFLEIGDVAGAEKCLAGASGKEGGESASEEVLLLRAEIELAAGRPGRAAELLGSTATDLPGGRAWAGALKAAVDLAGSGEAGHGQAVQPPGIDPSDLLDHPRLIARVAGRLVPLRPLLERRAAVLARMQGLDDQEVIAGWRELASLYREMGAARKEREVAWYLVHLRPGGLAERRRLGEALRDPREVVSRLAALSEALRLPLPPNGDRPEIEKSVAEARAFLGLPPRSG